MVQRQNLCIAGPRAMGMGGAGVAVTTNALATYWNPAGLAMTQTVDIRAQGGGQATDRLGLGDALHDLEKFNTSDTSPANLAKGQVDRRSHQSNRGHCVRQRIRRSLSQRTSWRTCVRVQRVGRRNRRWIRLDPCASIPTRWARDTHHCGGPDGASWARSQTGGVLLCLCLFRQNVFNRNYRENHSRRRVQWFDRPPRWKRCQYDRSFRQTEHLNDLWN